MTTKVKTKTPAELAAEHLAACEAAALATQAELIAAQRKAVAAMPQIRSVEEARALLATATANDAIRGTREALALAEQFEHERRQEAELIAAQRDAEASARAVGERHADAEAALRAAQVALETEVQATASKLADDARLRYGQALQALYVTHAEYLIALFAATAGNPPQGSFLPALPHFGCVVKPPLAQVDGSHVYYADNGWAAWEEGKALRSRIIAGDVE